MKKQILWTENSLILRSVHSENGAWLGYTGSIADSRPPLKAEPKLEANDIPPMSNLVKDLSDGVRLIQLMVSNQSFTDLILIFLRWDVQEIMGIVDHDIMTQTLQAIYSSLDRRYLPWPI